MSLGPDDYRGKPVNSRQGQAFVPWDRRGATSIEVLSFLNGKPWDAVALGYVHALWPSHVRVTDGTQQLDAQRWRVTVVLADDGTTIERIFQEVEVGLPDECPHGAGLECALKHGLKSKQVEWENAEGMDCWDFTGSGPMHYKLTESGCKIPFPK